MVKIKGISFRHSLKILINSGMNQAVIEQLD